MPRIAIALDSWLLESRTESRGDVQLEHATAALLLAYVFGWRASTVAAVKVEDCSFLPSQRLFRFSETFCKGSCTNDRFFRILDLPEHSLPGLSTFLHFFLAMQPQIQLLSSVGLDKGLPAALQLVCLQLLPVLLPDWDTPLTSHCVRVGTCTTLVKLGVSDSRIKAWIGWFPNSTAWLSYIRAPVFTLAECQFAARVFEGALPFSRAS